jgi:hypothetical protein
MRSRFGLRSAVLAGVVTAAVGALTAGSARACVTPPPSDPRMGHSSPTAVLGTLGHGPGEGAPVGGMRAAGPVDPVGSAATPLQGYLQTEHMNRGVGAQAQDALQADSYVLAHQLLVRRMLDPEVGQDSQLGTAPGTAVVLYHLDNGHWDQSPGDQVRAITDDFPDWYAMHRMMLDGTVQSLQSGSRHDDHSGGHGGH